jgi:LysR family transcriptional regulator, benzoate and cis,cis-muconate-responsive activator of ben and cat genes
MDISRLELRHLRYFVAVAEELHFGRAATRLGIAQPPLSQQIQHLERALGTQVFERTRRKVQLTDAGHVLLGDARRILSDVDRAFDGVRRAGRGEVGTLTVAFAASVMFLDLPRIIREFRSRYPGVTLELREMPTGPQIAALERGEIDIGFLREPPPHPRLTIETVMREPLHIAIAHSHPLAARKRIPLSRLAEEDFVLFPEDVAPGLYAQVMALCLDAGFAPRVVQVSRELYTTVSLVEAGVGVTIVPASIEKMGWTGVRYVPIPRAETRIAMATLAAAEGAKPVVKSFIALSSRAKRA